jgi:hypothetical protein
MIRFMWMEHLGFLMIYFTDGISNSRKQHHSRLEGGSKKDVMGFWLGAIATKVGLPERRCNYRGIHFWPSSRKVGGREQE